MPASNLTYHSYLLRLWLAGDDGNPQWRIALVNPQSGEQHGFASLEDLIVNLHGKMEKSLAGHLASKPIPTKGQQPG